MFHQSLAELSRVETDLQDDEIDTNITTGKKELLAPDTGQVYFDNVKFSSLAKSYSKNDLVENSVSLTEKSIQKQKQNRVFGYGFIWILSGQLLRNNQSYQGDYFHKGFQPFVADNAYVKLDSYTLKPSTIDYKINVSKLLKYESALRSNQKKPFASVKNAIQIQSQFRFRPLPMSRLLCRECGLSCCERRAVNYGHHHEHRGDDVALMHAR